MKPIKLFHSKRKPLHHIYIFKICNVNQTGETSAYGITTKMLM